MRLICLLRGHDWGLGEVVRNGSLTHFRLCHRCRKYEVQNIVGRWMEPKP